MKVPFYGDSYGYQRFLKIKQNKMSFLVNRTFVLNEVPRDMLVFHSSKGLSPEWGTLIDSETGCTLEYEGWWENSLSTVNFLGPCSEIKVFETYGKRSDVSHPVEISVVCHISRKPVEELSYANNQALALANLKEYQVNPEATVSIGCVTLEE